MLTSSASTCDAPHMIKHKTCAGCIDREARKAIQNDDLCAKCRKKERNRAWRESNPGAMAISAKQWRDAGNKTNRSPELLARQRSARLSRYHDDQAVRDKAIADARKRRLAKPDVVKAENAAWRAAHGPELRAYHAEYQRNRRATDPVFHRRCLDQQTMWRVRNWAKDSESEAWIRRVEDQDIDPTWRRRMHGWHAGRCYVCNNPCDDLTIEHVVPRSRGGPTVRQNIVLSCPSCNYSRQDRMWGAEWMPRESAMTTMTDSR